MNTYDHFSIFDQSEKSLQCYKKGDIIFNQDSLSSGLYCISSGSVKIYSTEESGKEVIFRIATVGEIIGHSSLFGQRRHISSAQAMQDTNCFYLKQSEVLRLMRENPDSIEHIIMSLCRETELAFKEKVNLVKRNVRERLATYFEQMALKHGELQSEGVKINLQLSREEMASIVGTANETVIRFISEFKALGLISEENKRFLILNPDQLSKIANMGHESAKI